jgi:SAM-dependent methyltransferase
LGPRNFGIQPTALRAAADPGVRQLMALRDPKRIVEEGYDRIAERHAEWASRTRTEERTRYVTLLLSLLRPGVALLELGCGAGNRTTQELAPRFRLIGVDLSAHSVALARRNVPGAEFIHADMTQINFPPDSFHAIIAFYSIIHVPRAEHAALLGRVASWLRPGGFFVATLGVADTELGFEAGWLGTPMYWSAYDPDTGRRLVEAAGLVVDRAAIETADEDGQPVSFLWVVARRPDLVDRQEP